MTIYMCVNMYISMKKDEMNQTIERAWERTGRRNILKSSIGSRSPLHPSDRFLFVLIIVINDEGKKKESTRMRKMRKSSV